MTFLAPFGLLALLALPVIIILHFIRERRRRVVVPSLLLWQQLPRRPDAQRRRRLPLTLLLLLHLLAAAALALALSQPGWLLNAAGAPQHLALVLDTSTSMAAGSGGTSRLERARQQAATLINALRGDDTITLVSAGRQARLLDSGGPESAPRLLATLERLSAGSVGTDMAGALTIAQAALEAYPDGRVVIFSDGALPTLADDLQGLVRTRPVEWRNVGGQETNLAIVTLAARPWSGSAPGEESLQLFARIANYGDLPTATSLRLFGDDQLLNEQTISVSAGSDVDLTWTLPPGIGVLRAELDGRDALPADDNAALSLSEQRPVETLIVSAAPGALERALRAVPGLNVRSIAPTDYTDASSNARATLTIFDGTLPERWPAGGVLVINPPAGATLPTEMPLVADTLVSERELREGEPLRLLDESDTFDGLSLESVRFGALRRIEPPDWARVQATLGDVPLILRGRAGASEVAIWSFDLAGGNLTSRLVFPLLVARTVRDLMPNALPAAVTAGERVTVRPGPRTEQLEIRAPAGSTETISRDEAGELVLPVTFDEPGIYTLTGHAGDEVVFAGQVAVNAGSPIESDLRALPVPALLNNPPDDIAPEERQSQPDSRPIWLWLAAFALLIMMVEWMYVHRPAPRPRATAGDQQV